MIVLCYNDFVDIMACCDTILHSLIKEKDMLSCKNGLSLSLSHPPPEKGVQSLKFRIFIRQQCAAETVNKMELITLCKL